MKISEFSDEQGGLGGLVKKQIGKTPVGTRNFKRGPEGDRTTKKGPRDFP